MKTQVHTKLGPFYGLIKQRENCYRNSSLLTLFNQSPP